MSVGLDMPLHVAPATSSLVGLRPRDTTATGPSGAHKAAREPSRWMTMRLRVLALATGTVCCTVPSLGLRCWTASPVSVMNERPFGAKGCWGKLTSPRSKGVQANSKP